MNQLILNWLLGDHLGSTSMVSDASGTMVSEIRYSAFGETRYENGSMTTDYLYTGQRQEVEIGLYYYVARWYDPGIGRFIQADSIVPNQGSAKSFDRFAYTSNNPVKYIDPSGHMYLAEESWPSPPKWDPELNLSYPKIKDANGKDIAPGTPDSQFNIDNKSCGVVSIAAILETMCTNGGACLTANEFYDMVEIFKPSVRKGLDQESMAEIIDNLTPYSATIYWNYLDTGSNKVSLPMSDDTFALGLLSELLANGEYPIVGVEINGNSGAGYLSSKSEAVYHWEIVVGLSPKMDEVSLYNPFHNEFEQHAVGDFLEHWKYPGAYLREVIAVNVRKNIEDPKIIQE